MKKIQQHEAVSDARQVPVARRSVEEFQECLMKFQLLFDGRTNSHAIMRQPHRHREAFAVRCEIT